MQQIITAKLKLIATPEQHTSPIWWERATSQCKRCLPGRTGRERAFCQYAPMRRTTRPKRHALRAMPNCGGVRMRAPPERERSTDLDGPRVNDLPIEWGGL